MNYINLNLRVVIILVEWYKGEDCIFKRFDWIVINPHRQEWYEDMEIENLARMGSYHAPLLIIMKEQKQQI